MEVKRDILWRVYLCFIGIVCMSLAVLGRAVYIQQVEGEYWRSMSDSLHQKFVELDAERGTIYSEEGAMLSTSIPFFDVYMDFGAEGLRDKNGKRFRENIDSFAYKLATYFKDKSKSEYKKELQLAYNEGRRYFLLKKALSFDQYKDFRQFPLVRLGRNRSGVIVEVKTKRLNPYGLLARRTIGLARENAQNVGLERTFDTLLKGSTGKRLVRFIAGGAAVPVEGYEIDPVNGKDIITTLDINIQDIAETALMRMMEENGALHGTCLVMETKTGKIKAIANLGEMKDGSYDENLNYALQTTEPGSTVKLATLLSVLDAGSSKITDMVEVGSTGRQYVAVRNITDAERSPKSILTVREAFAHSSNVGMAKLAHKAFANDPDKFQDYLKRFHLTKKTGIEIIGEEPPRLPRWKKNREGMSNMLTMSFGYAINVSPLQTLMLYNAVANGGKLMKPYLVSSIRSNGVTVEEFEPEVLEESIVKPEVIAAAKLCMEAVVTEGTAKNVFKDFPFGVAGKTGTSHFTSGNIKYHHGYYLASFAGYFPANDPEYTCVVIIKTKPGARFHYGGQVAAPVFKEVATKLYAMYVQGKQNTKVPVVKDSLQRVYAAYTQDVKSVMKALDAEYKDAAGSNTWSVVNSDYSQQVVRPAAIAKKVIPDVRNMTLKDALYVLENEGVKVVAKGRGKVVVQDILPGTPIKKGQTISLVLN